jgi:hypothetical protein
LQAVSRQPVWSALSFRLAIRTIAVAIVCAASVAFFFRNQISNGFTLLSGDRYDSIIILSIFEHWYNVARGLSRWSQTNYFYPVAGSLGYNDGYLIYGLIYACFRKMGFDPFIGYELVNVTVRLIDFQRFTWLLAGFWAQLGLGPLGAILFTISNNLFMHVLHPQLLVLVPSCGPAAWDVAGAEHRSHARPCSGRRIQRLVRRVLADRVLYGPVLCGLCCLTLVV